MKHAMIYMTLLCALAGISAAQAAETLPLKHANIRLDQTTLRKGLQVFAGVCMGCHSARYVTYKDLMDYPEIGITRKQADDLRGEHPLTAALISGMSPADAKVSFGKVPPDLSLMALARRGGANYIYSILTGFKHDPTGRIPDGNYNVYFPGHRIAMPDPLSWLDHDPAETKGLEQQARDVAAFLTFIADPHQNKRHEIGFWVIGFLILMTLVLWLLKVEVWRDVKH